MTKKKKAPCVRKSISIPQGIWDAVEKIAKQKDLSTSWLIRKAIVAELMKQNKKEVSK